MSKNGFRLFKNYDPYITSSFGYRINPITKKRALHAGVDYGTNNKNLEVYPLENGKVLETGYNNVSGNFVYINFPRLNQTGLYEHLASINVKKGEEVTNKTVIGKTGQTGSATGIHLHFGWFKTNEYSKSWNNRAWEDFETYEYPEPLKYLGTPVLRDEEKNQFEVKISNLRVRETPNGKILGYINKGIYNILEETTVDNAVWIKVQDNYWISANQEFGTYYKKEEIKDTNQPSNLKPVEDNAEENKPKKKSLMEIFTFIKDFILKIIEFIKKIF